MLGRTDSRLRLLALLVVFTAISGAAVVRLSHWQLARGEELRGEAAGQLVRETQAEPQRGDIVDRRGTVLATTEYFDRLAAYPADLRPDELGPLVDALTGILELDPAAAEELRTQLASTRPYAVIAPRLTAEQSELIRAGLAGADGAPRLHDLVLEPRGTRVYPNPGGAPGTTLASQVLGFVTEDGRGHYGIEGFYDAALAGRATQYAALHDGGGRPLPGSAEVVEAGQEGVDVRLTIDASLQLQLERELYAAWVADKAKRVSAIVLDPDTGELLAWASVPGYDGNDARTVASRSPELLRDPIASSVYEPGSVMKMLTAAAALEHGVIGPEDPIYDSGALRFGSEIIHNADRRGRGRIPFKDAIAFSRNVATARVALRLDPSLDVAARRLYGMWRTFGLGGPTGIDIASEASGIVADPARQEWQPIDLANRAFGQGVAVTQVQLGVAFAAMANGGLRVTPHLVAGIGEQPRVVAEPQRIIDVSLAEQLQELQEHVTRRVSWYREGTQIPGYVVGGKTGTAQIWDAEAGRWAPDIFNFSFAGFVGTHRPEAVIVTRIEEAEPEVLGVGILELGITSYELYRRIAIHTMTALDVPPLPIPEPEPDPSASPDARRPRGSTPPDDARGDRGVDGPSDRGTDAPSDGGTVAPPDRGTDAPPGREPSPRPSERPDERAEPPATDPPGAAGD